MKTKIHINKQKIAQNVKHNTDMPVITAKNYKENKYGRIVNIKDKDGNVVARVVQAGETTGINQLSCGARVWIETEGEIEVLEK